MVVFRNVKDRVEAMRLSDIRIRGLKIESHLQGGEILAKIDVLCATEEAILGFLEVIKYFKGKIFFSNIRIMGETPDNSPNKVKVGQEGFMALMEAFTTGLFLMTYEFRFYNFDPQHTPLLAFVDSLVGNPSLQTICFPRNRED